MYIENPKNENYLNNENILFNTINENFKQILRDNSLTIREEMENIPINEIIFYVILIDINHTYDLSTLLRAEFKIIEEKFYKYPKLKQIFQDLINFIEIYGKYTTNQSRTEWYKFSHKNLGWQFFRQIIGDFNVFKNSLLSVLKESKDIYLSTEDSEKIIKIFREHLSYYESDSDQDFQNFHNITFNRIIFTYQAFHWFYIMRFDPAKVLSASFRFSDIECIFQRIKFLTQDRVKLKEFVNLECPVEYLINLVERQIPSLLLNKKVFYEYDSLCIFAMAVNKGNDFVPYLNTVRFYLRIVYLQWEKYGQTQNISTKTNQSTNKQHKIERLLEIMQLQ